MFVFSEAILVPLTISLAVPTEQVSSLTALFAAASTADKNELSPMKRFEKIS